MQIAEAFVKIRADRSQFERDMNGIQAGVASAGKKAGAEVAKAVDKSMDAVQSAAVNRGRSIAGTLAQYMGGALFISKVKGSIDAASNLNETLAKTKNVFGEASDAAESMAENAARTMGMSKRAYLDAASGLKGLLDNMGMASDEATQWSFDLTKMGSDLASAFNTAPADAVYALSAALRGETEPIRRYNVQISELAIKEQARTMGLYDGIGALDLNAKAQATMALMVDQTKSSYDDFAETADTYANQQRTNAALTEDASASFGEMLLPVMERVQQVLGILAEGFGKLPAPIQLAFVALAGFVALSGPLGGAVNAVKSLTTAFTGLGTASKVSLGAIGLALGVATTLWSVFSDGDEKTKDVAEATEDFAEQLKSATSELLTNAAAIRNLRGELPGTEVGLRTLSTATLAAFEAWSPGASEIIIAELGKVGLTAEDAAVGLGILGKSIERSTYNYGDFAKAMGEAENTIVGQPRYSDRFLELEEAARILRLTLGDLGDTAEGAMPNVETLTRGFLEQARGSSDLTAGLVEQAAATAAANGQGDDAVAVYLAYIAAAAGLSEEQRTLALDLDAAAKAGATAADSAGDGADALTEEEVAAAAAKKATAALSDELSNTTTEFDLMSAAASALKDTLDRVTGGALSLAEADSALEQSKADLAAQFLAVDEAGNLLSNTLDLTTERGRENAGAVREQVEAILAQGSAMVGAGKSSEEAATAMTLQTIALKNQLVAFGLTEEEAAAYLETLGLTPDNIETSIELYKTEQRKAELNDIIDQLGDIDAGAIAEIGALIDQGRYDEAENKLRAIAADREITLRVGVTGGGTITTHPQGSGGFRIVAAARGLYANRPTFGVFGEAGPEAILPLSRPSRLRELLSDPRVSGPVLDAMSQVNGGEAGGRAGGGGGGGGSGGATMAQLVEAQAWTGRQLAALAAQLARSGSPEPRAWGAEAADAFARRVQVAARAS